MQRAIARSFLAASVLGTLGAASADHARASTVLTASNTVLVLDGESLATLAKIPVGAAVEEFAATPDGQRVFLSTSHGVLLLQGSTNRAQWSLSAPLTSRPVQSMALSPDGSALYVLDYAVREARTAERVPEEYRAHRIDTASLAVSDLASYDARVFDLAVAKTGGALFTLEKDAGELLVQTSSSASPSRVALAPGGNKSHGMYLRLVTDGAHGRLLLPQLGDPGKIWVIDGATQSSTSWDLPKAGLPVRGAAISPDGSRLYLSALQTVCALDARDGHALAWGSLDGAFQQIAVSPDGASVYVTAPVYQKGGGVAKLRASDLSVEKVQETEEISPYAIVVLDR
ncbi:MAG: YncE family protein [Candidatus Eisenbacteria bacterium]